MNKMEDLEFVVRFCAWCVTPRFTLTPTLAAAEDSVYSRMRNYKRLKTTHRDNGVIDELTEYLTSDPLPNPQYNADGVYNPYIPPFDTL
jgi:hypothetical protein